MNGEANVAIVGGGVTGLSVAYNLAKKGMTNIVVLEKSYLGSGASGRNSGGARVSFNAPETITLARENIKMIESLSDMLGYDVKFRQKGYLFLAYTEDQVQLIKENVARQNALGLRTKVLEQDEAREIASALNFEGVLGAVFDPYAGFLDPFAVVRGYAKAARELNVEIFPFTEVKGVLIKNGKISSLQTSRGRLKTTTVVNAAGPDSSALASMVGIDLPSKPYRREMLITESLEPLLGPMVVSMDSGVHFHQSVDNGGVIGGMPPQGLDPVTYSIDSSLEFLKIFSEEVIRLCPRLKSLNIVRQWAGLIDYTADSSPILGAVDGIEGFVQANGWSGHGLQFCPIAGKLLAEFIVDGKTSLSIEPFNLNRFREGKLIKEKMGAFSSKTRELLGLKEKPIK